MPQTPSQIFAFGQEPDKLEVVALLDEYLSRIASLETNGVPVTDLLFQTKAEIDASLAYDANRGAEVVADPVLSNNGVYKKIGASGTGSWTRIADLPGSLIDSRNNAYVGVPAGAGGGFDNAAFGAGALGISTTAVANAAFGRSAGRSITTGSGNIFIGFEAGNNALQKVNADQSIAIGYGAYTTENLQVVLGQEGISETILRGRIMLNSQRALQHWLTGQNYFALAAGPSSEPTPTFTIGNVGVGRNALSSLLGNVVGGVQNTAMGDRALEKCVNGSDNSAFGAGTLQNMITGVGASAFGRLALANVTVGGNNTAYGDTALEFTVGDGITQAIGNTATGYSAAIRNSTGSFNCAYGIFSAGVANVVQRSTYSRSCAFGAEVMQFNLTGENNSLFGFRAGHILTSANNAGFGWETLRNLTSGKENAAFGYRSGWRITTGDNNTFIGDDSGFDGAQLVTASNSTAIGNGSYTDASNQMVFGNVDVTEYLLRSATGRLNIIGGQIQFPATQVPSANANTLDDYREKTGTLSVTVTPGSGSFTTVTATLDFTKVGRVVVWDCEVLITTAGTAAGPINIPLPFSAARPTSGYGIDPSSSLNALAVRVINNVAEVWNTTGGATIIASGRTIRVGGTYTV